MREPGLSQLFSFSNPGLSLGKAESFVEPFFSGLDERSEETHSFCQAFSKRLDHLTTRALKIMGPTRFELVTFTFRKYL